MKQASYTQESTSFVRRAEYPGIELRISDSGEQAWRYYSSDYEFILPLNWHGVVWHRQAQHSVDPGVVLCAHPGEVLVTQSVAQPGARVAIAFDAQVLAHYAARLDVNRPLCFSPSTRMSHWLAESLAALLEALHFATDPGAVEVRIVDFLGLAFTDLMASESLPVQTDRTWYAAGRMCERLLNDTLAELDLNALAVGSGLSRFQTLRAFKRRYGLPPHTYHLRVRLGLAQKRLREGLEPARVAAELGFVDQSHLTRHFRRFIGVTPGQYARVGGALLASRAYVPE